MVSITPDRFGYVGIVTSLLPSRWHGGLLGWLSPERAERDVFPTRYRINTLGAVRRHFPDPDWLNASYVAASLPRYHSNSYLLFSLIDAYQRIVPRRSARI